ESGPEALLRLMKHDNVLVEICLTSNDVILNVTGDHHPLPMYLKFGVPVALATDDPGVSRGDITQEYDRAAATYHLSYRELKNFARNSLTFSFLPGESIWKNAATGARVAACAADKPDAAKPSASCAALLSSSEKAQQQWALERAFSQFESRFGSGQFGKN
ncbi:MAG TPA: adenosine deaminase, partial [Candidatus Angelobacter sp.]